jgi:hypothetical protein
MATRWARVLRGLVASGVAVFVAAFAHVVGGGAAPDLAGVSLALAFSALVCIALAGQRVSVVRMSVAVILSQAAFHLLFAATPTSAAPPAKFGMAHMSMVPVSPVSVAPHALVQAMPDDGWMLMAHAAAALVTIVALVWGERAFWALCSTAVSPLARAARVVVVALVSSPSRVPVVVVQPDRRTAPYLITGLRHRGPPRETGAFV